MANDPGQDRIGMPLKAALGVLIQARRKGQITVTSMSSSREWPELSQEALDFHYVPSTMGGAIPLGVGLALAQPSREVVVISGDGSLLMSLGSLVTAVGTGVANLSVIVLENGCYEVTGGQKTAASIAGADLGGLAESAGFRQVERFRRMVDWQSRGPSLLSAPGPRFACLTVQPTDQDYHLTAPGPMSQQVTRLRRALQT